MTEGRSKSKEANVGHDGIEGIEGMAGMDGIVGIVGIVGMAGKDGNAGNVKEPMGLQLGLVVCLRALFRRHASKSEDWLVLLLLLLVVELPRRRRCRRAWIRVLALTRVVAVVPAEGKQHEGDGFDGFNAREPGRGQAGADGCRAMGG